METIELNIIGNLKFVTPQVVIFLISCYYYFRNKNFDGIMLSAGSGISLIILIYQIFIHPYHRFSMWPLDEFITIDGLLGFLNVLSSIAFITGFLILILKQIKTKTGTLEERIDNIQ